MKAWDLQNGYTWDLGHNTIVRWNQLQRVYYALHGKTLVAKGTNLQHVVREARFYA